MFEASVGIVLLLFSILAGVDLVRLAYTTAIIQFEVVRGVRFANIEANSNRTGFGATYNAELINTCDTTFTSYADCGGANANCNSARRACALRQFIRDNIATRALANELTTATTDWEDRFAIRNIAPGGIIATPIINNGANPPDAGAPGDLLIVDINVPVQLVSPIRIVIGNTINIRASSIGRNEF